MLTYTNWLKYRLHILIWGCFILNEVVAARSVSGTFRPFLNYVFFYSVAIALFYIHATVVLPFALRDRRNAIWRLPTLIALEILSYIFVCNVGGALVDTVTTKWYNRSMAIWPIWRCIYFLGFSTGYYFLTAYLKSQLEKADAEKTILEQLVKEKQTAIELTEARNAFLQAQVNPHLIFNTLNFIYVRTRKLDHILGRAVTLLSKVMRYAAEIEYRERLIPIAEEIEKAEQLIELFKIQHNNELYINITCAPNAESYYFSPLILLSLTENMLKHGDLTDAGSPGSIEIWIEDDTLIIATNNKIASNREVPSLNTGLDNVKKRLHNSHKERVTFHHEIVNSLHFQVTIRLKI